MPQIKVYLNRAAQYIIIDSVLDDLCRTLTAAVEAAFGIQGENDVAFDVFFVRYTSNESMVQIEVLYTAGVHEYGTGKVFDPDESEKMAACAGIRNGFTEFLARNDIVTITPSVWIRPQYKSKFVPGEPSH